MQNGFFYYNYAWPPPERWPLPAVCRARARYQPGLLRPRTRRIELPCWLIDAPTLPAGIRTRVAPENVWRERRMLELHLYRPHTLFEEQHAVEAERANVFVMFTGGEYAGLDRLFLPGERYLRLFDSDRRICDRITEMARRGMLEGEASRWDAQLLLCEILACLRAAVRTGEPHLLAHPGEAGGDGDLIRRIDRLLLTHLAEPYPRSRLAAELGVSVSTLSHRYRERTGRSIMQRRMELRLDQAATLLDSDLTLDQIAAQTGFSSGFHLSYAFKRRFGIAPRGRTGV
ncbi:MAG: helix-turn-helix transcriptional regulator [Lentisphaeria bacterium]|nr:helix-turn-helix transcriptional regulator [Lentisphaeria bacterium]